ncbi:MAG: hypothetical protein NTV22_09780 [bacterium]|nr:hypothetical protein [bacterium]
MDAQMGDAGTMGGTLKHFQGNVGTPAVPIEGKRCAVCRQGEGPDRRWYDALFPILGASKVDAIANVCNVKCDGLTDARASLSKEPHKPAQVWVEALVEDALHRGCIRQVWS